LEKMLGRCPAARKMFFYLLFAVLICACGCGYRFVGSGTFPGGVKSVCIHVFENHTSQDGAEYIFTNSLVYEFTRRGGVTLAGEKDADAQLLGVVKAIRTDTITHKDVYASDQLSVRAQLGVRLVSKSGDLLWADDNISEHEIYDVAGNTATISDENRKAALQELSDKMAERIYNQLTSDF